MRGDTRLDGSGRRWAGIAAVVAGTVVALPLVLTLLYAVVPPPASTLMILRLVQGYGLNREWVAYDDISPHLVAAVVASEDARFCSHRGVDWQEVERALDSDGRPRGASTITMQLAKNLFLWPGRSYVRKGLELPLAYWLDLVLSKRRLMEIYLNIVEWAPGVYGAEAASRHHFGKSAADLSRREAALLAAALPNPLERTAGRPGPVTRRAAARIERRMRGIGPYLDCLKQTSA